MEVLNNDKMNINIIIKLWDDIIDEMFILLLDSFNRFQDTLQYQIAHKNDKSSGHKYSL